LIPELKWDNPPFRKENPMLSATAVCYLPEHLEQAAARIAAAAGVVRRGKGGWLMKPAAAQQPPEPLSEALVSALLSHGHLVPHRSGGYQTLRQSMAGSGRLGAHRPPRPKDGEALTAPPAVNDAESPLAWLRARRDRSGLPLISEMQFLAGERLRADYERGCMGARTTASWDPSAAVGRGGGNSIGHVTDRALAARQALFAALDQVGPELSGILVQVCCLSAGLEQAERLLDMPQRSGKAVLSLALTRLARHYGFVKPHRPSGGLSHWGLPDYRPTLAAQAEP
jgi:hypothetical protein